MFAADWMRQNLIHFLFSSPCEGLFSELKTTRNRQDYGNAVTLSTGSMKPASGNLYFDLESGLLLRLCGMTKRLWEIPVQTDFRLSRCQRNKVLTRNRGTSIEAE